METRLVVIGLIEGGPHRKITEAQLPQRNSASVRG